MTKREQKETVKKMMEKVKGEFFKSWGGFTTAVFTVPAIDKEEEDLTITIGYDYDWLNSLMINDTFFMLEPDSWAEYDGENFSIVAELKEHRGSLCIEIENGLLDISYRREIGAADERIANAYNEAISETDWNSPDDEPAERQSIRMDVVEF